MNQIFFQLNHPRGGEMKFQTVNRHIEFDCHWPFDMDTNEWINLSNRFSLDGFVRQVKRLAKARRIRIPGTDHGNLCLRRINGHALELSVVAGNRMEEFTFRLPVCAERLLP